MSDAGSRADYVDSDWGATYRVTIDGHGRPIEICRRHTHQHGPPLVLTGRVARLVIKNWRDQAAKGGRGHV